MAEEFGYPAMDDDSLARRLVGRVSIVLRHPETGAQVDFRTWPRDDHPRCSLCNAEVKILSARSGVVEAHIHGNSSFPLEVLLNWEHTVSERRSNLPPGYRDRDAASLPGRQERG